MTRKMLPFNTSDCLIEVTAWAGLTVFSILRVNILMVYKHANYYTTNYSLDPPQHNTMTNVKNYSLDPPLHNTMTNVKTYALDPPQHNTMTNVIA
jgi:hypothetical protein